MVKIGRNQKAYFAECVDNSKSVSLPNLSNDKDAFSKVETNYIHCVGGCSSIIVVSILKSSGLCNVVCIASGFSEIAKLMCHF